MTDEITSLSTDTMPDPDQVALVISNAFSQAYNALEAAWNMINEQRPTEAQDAIVAVNNALNVMTEQIALQSAVIAGILEANESLRDERDQAIDDLNSLEAEVEDRVEAAYEQGADEAWEDPYALQEIEQQAVEDYAYGIIDSATYAAEKLCEVGEIALADEVEDTARHAVGLREEAEKLLARAHDVAWSKRPKMLKPGEPLPFDGEEGGSVDD